MRIIFYWYLFLLMICFERELEVEGKNELWDAGC